MKRTIIVLMVLFAFGCARKPEGQALVKINNYEISREEFEREFKDSVFGREDTLQSKKEFLSSLINRKLIMQDAQRQGLDKQKGFLKMIERFWEQSLLKSALDKKTQAIAGAVFVSDKEIEEAYKNMVREGRTEKPYQEMYSQIKWEITAIKQTELLGDWVKDLREKADIKINHGLLTEEK